MNEKTISGGGFAIPALLARGPKAPGSRRPRPSCDTPSAVGLDPPPLPAGSRRSCSLDTNRAGIEQPPSLPEFPTCWGEEGKPRRRREVPLQRSGPHKADRVCKKQAIKLTQTQRRAKRDSEVARGRKTAARRLSPAREARGQRPEAASTLAGGQMRRRWEWGWVPYSPQARLRSPESSSYSPGSGNPATSRCSSQSRGGWEKKESGRRQSAASPRRGHPAPPPKRRAQSILAAPEGRGLTPCSRRGRGAGFPRTGSPDLWASGRAWMKEERAFPGVRCGWRKGAEPRLWLDSRPPSLNWRWPTPVLKTVLRFLWKALMEDSWFWWEKVTLTRVHRLFSNSLTNNFICKKRKLEVFLKALSKQIKMTFNLQMFCIKSHL